MPNPIFSYTAVASPLLGAEELEQLSRKLGPRLEQAGGRSGEPSADEPRLHLVLTGGTEQQVLDDLFASAQKHLSAASYASHALPFETFLLSMLLEEHKEILRLRREVAELRHALRK